MYRYAAAGYFIEEIGALRTATKIDDESYNTVRIFAVIINERKFVRLLFIVAEPNLKRTRKL